MVQRNGGVAPGFMKWDLADCMYFFLILGNGQCAIDEWNFEAVGGIAGGDEGLSEAKVKRVGKILGVSGESDVLRCGLRQPASHLFNLQA